MELNFSGAELVVFCAIEIILEKAMSEKSFHLKVH